MKGTPKEKKRTTVAENKAVDLLVISRLQSEKHHLSK